MGELTKFVRGSVHIPMDGTIQISTVIASVGGLLASVVGAYLMLLRYTLTQKEKEFQKSDLDLLAKLVETASKLEELEARQNTMSTDLTVQANQIKHVDEKLKSISENMVTRAEWVLHAKNQESTLTQILSLVRRPSYSTLSVPPKKG